MDNSQAMNNCIYNILYTQFNEDFGIDSFFAYNLQYPVFYNFKNESFNVNQSILNNINSVLKTDAYTFKNGVLEEEQEYNNTATKNSLPKQVYRVMVTYSVTFNKNHILSTILNLTGFSGVPGTKYNDLYNYNYDLLTGNRIMLKDIFNEGVDYIKVINDYVNYKIGQNKDLYYPGTVVDIPADQAFYLTDDGLVVYFGDDEIAPASFGIPKFKLSFSKFAPYINSRFYCDVQNIARRNFRYNKRG